MLTRREESDTYLAQVCRHRRSRKSLVKIDEISGAFSQHCGLHQFSLGSFCSSDACRCESGRFNIYLFNYPFILILSCVCSPIFFCFRSRYYHSRYYWFSRFIDTLIIDSFLPFFSCFFLVLSTFLFLPAVYIYDWWKPKCWLKAPDISSIFTSSFCSSDVYRRKSGRCRPLPFFLTFFIILPFQVFLLYYYNFPQRVIH